jgi:hypothetical protein
MSIQQSPNKVFSGYVGADTFIGETNKLNFVIQQALSKVQTATIVRVVSCTNNGDTSPVGFVDVRLLVDQVDGGGQAFPHGTVFNLPYLRYQGGSNAIILDPSPNDLGIAVFASRDISNVKTTKNNAPPASQRMFNFSDGLYLGGLLNGTPQNFIKFQNDSITIHAQNIVINGNVQINGNMDCTGNVKSGNIGLSTHVHSGVQSGSDNTGEPV